MLDRSIPFYNLILKCSCPPSAAVRLPPGFSLRLYQAGDEDAWAALECSIGDFRTPAQARQYFLHTYGSRQTALQQRCLFAVNSAGQPAGSCIAWQDVRCGQPVSSLHWLVVHPAFRGQGLGRALCLAAMRLFEQADAYPVYLHTQPWSWRALMLYAEIGFRLQKTDSFAEYENQYAQGMAVLRGILSPKQYRWLSDCAE